MAGALKSRACVSTGVQDTHVHLIHILNIYHIIFDPSLTDPPVSRHVPVMDALSFKLTLRIGRFLCMCTRACARIFACVCVCVCEASGSRCPSGSLLLLLLSAAEERVVLLTLCNGPCIPRLSGGAH